MTRRRAALIGVVVFIAVLVAPFRVGVNTATLIDCAAPVAVVAIGLWPRKPPAGDSNPPSSPAGTHQ